MKSRRPLSFVLSALAALAIAMPMAARDTYAKSTKATSTTVEIITAATFGGKQIQPGTYTIRADESTVTLLHNGKMVAQAPAQWRDETSKAETSNVVFENNQIKEIHFGGKMKYVEVMD
jgi:ribose/xylose/arabinose/galactoside ABC-type transport system permease subunit